MSSSGCHPFDYGDAINTECLGFQIQTFLLKQGILTEEWVEAHGVEADEEVVLETNTAADADYKADAKQSLVNRIMSGDLVPLDRVDPDGEGFPFLFSRIVLLIPRLATAPIQSMS